MMTMEKVNQIQYQQLFCFCRQQWGTTAIITQDLVNQTLYSIHVEYCGDMTQHSETTAIITI